MRRASLQKAHLLARGTAGQAPGSAMHSRDDALLPGARVQVLHGPDSRADRSRVMIAPIGQVFRRRQTPSYRYDVVIVQGGPSRDACL